MTGDTGILELGFTYDAPGNPWSAEFGVHGYTGIREGVTGTLRVEYKL
jgi:hypothetical protein